MSIQISLTKAIKHEALQANRLRKIWQTERARKGDRERKDLEMNTKNRQIDKKITKQIRIDAGYHKIAKTEATKAEKSIKEYVETILVEFWGEEKVIY